MRLGIKVIGDLVKIIDDEIVETSTAMKRAIKTAGVQVQTELRAQARAAGFKDGGKAIANAWRLETFPKAGIGPRTLRPAALVWTKMPAAVAAFEDGTVIRAKGGGWLAIPSPDVRKMRGAARVEPAAGGGTQGVGARRYAITPASFSAATGIKLRFVYGPRASLLVADGVKSRNGRSFKAPTAKRLAQGRKLDTFVAFILLRQVSMRKRLDVAGVARRADGYLEAAMAAEFAA